MSGSYTPLAIASRISFNLHSKYKCPNVPGNLGRGNLVIWKGLPVNMLWWNSNKRVTIPPLDHCWQVRCMLCVFTAYLRDLSSRNMKAQWPQHSEDLDSPVPYQDLNAFNRRRREKRGNNCAVHAHRACRQSFSKVLLDVTQSPARQLRIEKKNSTRWSSDKRKRPYPFVKWLKRDLPAVLIVSSCRSGVLKE